MASGEKFSKLTIGNKPKPDGGGDRAGAYRGSVQLAPKPVKPGTLGSETMPLLTNLFPMKIRPNTVMWQYHVNIYKTVGKHVNTLSMGGGDDYTRYIKREKCWDVLQKLISQHQDIFSPGDIKITYVYDRCRSLMTDMKIPGIECGKKPRKFTVSIYDRDIEGEEEWTVEVQMTEAEGVVISDIASITVPNLADRNMEPKRILEIMTSQVLYQNWAEGGSVVVTGQKAYDYNTVKWPRDCGAKFTMQGFKKAVTLTSNKYAAAMSIDPTLGAFFKEGPVDKFLEAEFPRLKLDEGLSEIQKRTTLRDAHKDLKGIVIKVTHVKGKAFKCQGFNLTQSVKDIKFEHEGGSKALTEYYRTKYGVQLKYPNMPPLRDERNNYYPIEVCRVAPNQRVPISKQTPKLMQSMIKDSAVLPAERQQIIGEMVKENKLLSNDILEGMGVELLDQFMTVDGRRLPLPTMKMHGGVTIPVQDSGDYRLFRGARFLVGSMAKRVAVLNVRGCATTGLINQFYDKLVQVGKQYGVALPQRYDYLHSPNSTNDIKGYFSGWSSSGASKAPDFVLSLLPEGAEKFHEAIKCQELLTGIQTQNVKQFNAEKILRVMGICVNFLSKTNMKLGGVDNEIVLNDMNGSSKWLGGDDVMICGLAVSRSVGAASDHLAVGLVANTGKTMFDFTGEHFFVSPTNDNKAEGLDVAMAELCKRRYETRGKMPSSVIFFRDGVSEGQFAQVVATEVPLITKGLNDMAVLKIGLNRAKSYKPNLTVVNVTKGHNERLFPANLKLGDKRRAPEQNIKPGTVVDTGMVHPIAWEFYISSHIALQGTAKPAKYGVILDENGFNQNDMQALCHNLCYGHQIIQKAISLPVPVFAAQNMAKRGGIVYRAYQEDTRYAEMDATVLSRVLSVGNQHKLAMKQHFA